MCQNEVVSHAYARLRAPTSSGLQKLGALRGCARLTMLLVKVAILFAGAATALVPPASPHITSLRRGANVPRLSARRPASRRALVALSAGEAAETEPYRGTLADLGDIVDMAHAEFGKAYSDPVSRFGLRSVLFLGFFLRLTYGVDADHSVYCCRDGGGDLVGVVELSLQPYGKLAGPIPPPPFAKAALGGDRPLRPYLSNLLVAPSRRKRGLGAALVRKCETETARWGFSRLALHHDRDDAPLTRFYEKFGFRTEADAPAFLVDGFMLQFVAKPISPLGG